MSSYILLNFLNFVSCTICPFLEYYALQRNVRWIKLVKNGGDLALYHGIYLQGQRSKADFFRLKVKDTFFVVKENDFLAKSAITSRTSFILLAQQQSKLTQLVPAKLRNVNKHYYQKFKSI